MISKEDTNMESDESFAVEDGDKSLESSDPIVTYVTSSFRKAKTNRQADETRWLRAYRNYRGIYGEDVKFTETEKSRIFVKTTKTKVLAAYGQLIDILFGSVKFPLVINPTSMPEGVAESVHINLGDNPNPEVDSIGLEQPGKNFILGPDNQLKPGETMDDLQERMSGTAKKVAPVSDRIIEGAGTTAASVTYHPAFVAAKKMEKKIHDQLEESNANKHLRSAVFEQVLFGTGIMKGPFSANKEYPKWDETGEYTPVMKTTPATTFVSCWDFYPDPDASNMDEAEYTVHRHKMSRSQLRALGTRPFFLKDGIKSAIEIGENYTKEWWEDEMKDYNVGLAPSRFEVLEYWGYIDREIMEDQLHFKIPSSMKKSDQLSVNIWICNNEILRMVVNPFTPMRLPYQAAPFEFNPYSFFGVGMAENLDDSQTLMNGFMRLAADNAILSGNLIFEIDEDALAPGQDLKIHPGKVFRRQGGAPGQAIFGTSFPNVAAENLQLFDKARLLADESSGFPSFAHGQTGVGSLGRTASGISMLMSAANGSIRTVVKNIDDYLLAPLGKALFAFNMQFDFDETIKGDLEVRANGTESLMANEVRSQRLMQFLEVVMSNPATAPFAKVDYIIRQIARSMELDPDKVTNSMQDAAVMSEILKKFNPPQPPIPGMPSGAPQGAMGGVGDTSGGGGGQIGIGTAPTPGEQGFSGNV
jgi:hypothetical protein